MRVLVPGLTLCLLAAAVAAQAPRPAEPGDWPQWRGPDRNGISREQGLARQWPAGGPRLLWKAEGLGGGYSSPSVAGGRVYGLSYRGDGEVVWALEGGREVWNTRIAEANRGVSYGEGPRSTPTVSGGLVYALGVSGDLACLRASDGAVQWRKSLTRDLGGHMPDWGYSESPLLHGGRLVVTPGGAAATLAALDPMTGAEIWRGRVPGGDDAQYSSVIAADLPGRTHYVQFLRGGVVGVDAREGRLLWRYENPANPTANCSTPIYRDGHVFAASNYGVGGGLVRLTGIPDGVRATEVYFTRQMQNHHGGMILVGEHLYGFDSGTLTCLRFLTGEVAWSDRSVGKGSLVYADGHLYARGERGSVALVEATPTGYVERGRMEQPERTRFPAWAHPVVSGGKLYLRDQEVLLCYDVRG